MTEFNQYFLDNTPGYKIYHAPTGDPSKGPPVFELEYDSNGNAT